MSNNNSPSKNKDQAGSSSQNNPIDVHCIDNIDFDNLTTEKALEIADSIINGFKSQFPTPQSVADVLLGWEAAGFPPKKMEKNVLKAELLHIEFQTTEWKEWWQKMEPMTQEDIKAELKERNERRKQNEN